MQKDTVIHMNDVDKNVSEELSPRGRSSTFQKEVVKFNDDIEKKKNRLAMELEGDICIVEAMETKADAAKEMRATKEEAWDKMLDAFRISKKDLRQIRCQGVVRSIVNMLYLLVIVGCELDLYGFMMAYSTYWQMGYTIVNILLVLAPVGYLLAILMYMNYSKALLENPPNRTRKNKSESTAKKLREERMQSKSNRKSTGGAASSGLKKECKSTAPKINGLPGLKGQRTPIRLEYYHFMPILRYYLVIKDKTNADVEGIFRVNSLSSFTLGIAQIISIVFQVIVAQNPLTIFVKINIGSQIINWVITILYFITPVSEMMASSIKVSALSGNSNDQLRHIHEEYLEAIKDGAQTDNLAEIKKIQKFVNTAIAYSGDCPDVDLSKFPMDLKLKALKLLRLKAINSYSGI